MTPGIYLDHNATTPVHRDVLEAMLPWFSQRFENPSSTHPGGRAARAAVERARAQVAACIGADPSEVLFTSGGTESSNLAIVGTSRATPGGIALSTIEHPATRATVESLGVPVVTLKVSPTGAVIPPVLPPNLCLVTVMHANNETGVVQPIRALSDLAHAAGASMHTDAAQSVGKIPVDVNTLGVDLLTIAGHKLYGPKGVGALYVRAGTPLHPVLHGAQHERGLRPGTENVPGIVGLGVACELAVKELTKNTRRWSRQTDRILARLMREIPGLLQTGSGDFLPNTLNIRFPGVSGNTLLSRCPNLYASTGSACHSGIDQPSPVLLAMGVDPVDARSAVRLSLGRSTTDIELDHAIASLLTAYTSLTQNECSK